jgi:hypothetical protein
MHYTYISDQVDYLVRSQSRKYGYGREYATKGTATGFTSCIFHQTWPIRSGWRVGPDSQFAKIKPIKKTKYPRVPYKLPDVINNISGQNVIHNGKIVAVVYPLSCEVTSNPMYKGFGVPTLQTIMQQLVISIQYRLKEPRHRDHKRMHREGMQLVESTQHSIPTCICLSDENGNFNKFHYVIGPFSIMQNDDGSYYVRGRFHRYPNMTGIEGPSIHTPTIEVWHQNGIVYRKKEPAVVNVWGDQFWHEKEGYYGKFRLKGPEQVLVTDITKPLPEKIPSWYKL